MEIQIRRGSEGGYAEHKLTWRCPYRTMYRNRICSSQGIIRYFGYGYTKLWLYQKKSQKLWVYQNDYGYTKMENGIPLF